MPYVIVAILLSGCGVVCPQVRATRCNGQIVETCGTNKRWQRAMHCARIKPLTTGVPLIWTCGKTDTGHTCVPRETK